MDGFVNKEPSADVFREITRMKQARGAGGLPGADDDDFAVVPVESTSESTDNLECLKNFILFSHPCSTLTHGLTMHRGRRISSEWNCPESQQLEVHQCRAVFSVFVIFPAPQVKRPGSWMPRAWLWAVRLPLPRKKRGTWWTAPSTGQTHLSTKMITYRCLRYKLFFNCFFFFLCCLVTLICLVVCIWR